MHIINRAYLGYIHYMHSNHEYFWRVYELNEYLAKICMHSLLRPLPVWTPTFQACMEACESNTGCVDISWIPPTGAGNGVCYMKNELNTGFVNSAVWGARRWSVCPNMDGQPWEDGCGAWYQVECFMDRFGGVMAPSPVTTHSFEMCIYLCGQNPNCVDISWEQGYPAGTCWLKSSVGEASQNMDVYGARQLSPCTEMLPVYTNL